jgi:hypothetical protein
MAGPLNQVACLVGSHADCLGRLAWHAAQQLASCEAGGRAEDMSGVMTGTSIPAQPSLWDAAQVVKVAAQSRRA